MLPAGQRLDAHGLTPADAELRLVLEHDLAHLEAAPELAGEHQAVDGVVVAGRGVDLHRPLRLLGAVERHVGAAQELVGARAVLRVARHADARPHVDHDPVDRERVLERRDERVGDRDARLGARGAAEQDRELVAAQAHQHVLLRQGRGQARRHVLQQPVARGVPERVVDGLEVVEVDDHQRDLLAVPGGVHPRLEALAEREAVRQPGEGVVHRAVGVARGLARADVDGQERQPAQRHEREVRLGRGRHDRGEREHEAGRDHLEGEVGAEVADRRLADQQRRRRARRARG